MSKKQIAVENLRVGMYVVELDRSWLGTPFDFQGFPVSSEEQITALKGYCSTVFVDPEREGATPQAPRESTGPIRGSVVYKERTRVEDEVADARGIYTSCEATVERALESARRDGAIDGPAIRSAVASMTTSIERNPDAMMLLDTLREKKSYAIGRALSTSVLMTTFGRFLQFPRERLELLGVAGMLLDAGKSRLPDSMLDKSDLLDPEQYAQVKDHVVHSTDLVRKANGGLPRGVDDIILQHHEREDGSGYPKGLASGEISIDGAIAGLVDSFSALTSSRSYAEQLSPSGALALMHKLRGRLFRESLVEQFIQCIGIYPVGSLVELNSGEVAMVIAQNQTRRLQPRVMVVLGVDWRPIQPQVILDLVKQPKVNGDEPYRIRRTLPKDRLQLDPREFFL